MGGCGNPKFQLNKKTKEYKIKKENGDEKNTKGGHNNGTYFQPLRKVGGESGGLLTTEVKERVLKSTCNR